MLQKSKMNRINVKSIITTNKTTFFLFMNWHSKGITSYTSKIYNKTEYSSISERGIIRSMLSLKFRLFDLPLALSYVQIKLTISLFVYWKNHSVNE